MKSVLSICLLALLPAMVSAAEPEPPKPDGSVINMDLPVHQQKKVHPELSDPVLGDQAEINEWAWSPQYAKRFDLPVQTDGLPDGGLWLVGVRIGRIQNGQRQSYQCRIVGLMDSNLPILMPPGEIYNDPMGLNLPGKNERKLEGLHNFTPGQVTWPRQPANKAERRPRSGGGTPYMLFHRHFLPDLAYFELWAGSCSHFDDPAQFRNELRFPTQAVGKKDHAVYEDSAVTFDFPDTLMKKIYPYAHEAWAWGSCLARRVGNKADTLPLWALERFKGVCESGSPEKYK